MKELSIKEKAKRYDEAKINGSRLWECGEITRENYEYMFPEIKESEDEIIRKELLNAFQESEDSLYMVLSPERRKSFIAWLEKQGEHANFRNKIQIGDKVTRNEAGILVNISQLHRVAKERKEQEEPQVYETEDGKVITYSETDGYKVKQKSTDNEMKGILRTEYEKGRADAIAEMQNPAWSKKDEQHIDSLLKRLYGLRRNEFERTRFAISEDIDFLKSLKNRVGCEVNCTAMWKPSNEQINALEYYIYSTSPTATITKGTIYGNLMVELLEQLKKLKS